MISREIQQGLSTNAGIREAFHEARQQKKIYGDEQVYDLSLGNPMAKSPAKVRDMIRKFADTEELEHSYMSEAGYEDVREKIADALNCRYGTQYDEENVIMTTGVAGGINVTLKELLDPGDEVIIIRPYYPAYVGFVKNHQGKVVTVDAKEPDFVPDFQQMEEKITERTKIVIINSPNNPSGTIYTMDTAKKLSELLCRKQAEYQHPIYLLSDEPYRELVYDDTTLPWWPAEYKNTIVSYSFSKTLSLAGERIGYLLVPPEMEDSELVTRAVRLCMGRLGFVNAPAFFQRIVGECLEESIELDFYDEGRRMLYHTLKRLGFTCVEPKGAFYIFVKSPLDNEDDFMDMARKRHLIFVSGKAFGKEGYARVSFCGGPKMIEKSISAFELLAKDCGLI